MSSILTPASSNAPKSRVFLNLIPYLLAVSSKHAIVSRCPLSKYSHVIVSCTCTLVQSRSGWSRIMYLRSNLALCATSVTLPNSSMCASMWLASGWVQLSTCTMPLSTDHPHSSTLFTDQWASGLRPSGPPLAVVSRSKKIITVLLYGCEGYGNNVHLFPIICYDFQCSPQLGVL